MAESVTLRTGLDATADEGRPNQNYAKAGRVYVNGNSGGAQQAQVFIYFKKPFRLADAVTVVAATLRLRLFEATTEWNGANTLTIRRITQNWKESTLTWNNRPSTVATNAATKVVTGGSNGDEIEIDLTAMMNDVAAGDPWFGVRITVDTSGDKKFHSSETNNADYRPMLDVSYAQFPQQPIDLSPDGERAISLAQPTVLWSFRTALGASLQSEYRVILGNTAAKVGVAANGRTLTGTPDQDSGWVANTRTSSNYFTALANNTQYYWRVAVRDDDGLESKWSDLASFFRRTKGVLDITSPGATTDDNTPPIVHTFTGRTQAETEYVLFEYDAVHGQWKELVREARRADTLLTFTFPKARAAGKPPYFRKLLTDYKVRLRVWDTFNRESSPGDRTYVEDEQTFTFVNQAGVSPVTSITVVDVQDKPAVDVLFTDLNATPDEYALRVDGETKDADIDPADVLISGDDYSYRYWGAIPGVQHTYKVERVVNGKQSAGNPSTTHTSRNIGVWVGRPATGDAVLLLARGGRTDRNLTIGESSTVYTVVGKRAPVSIIDTIRGYEGSVSGILADYLGKTAEEYRAQLLDFKGEAGTRTLRLIMSGINIPIELGQLQVTPQPDASTYVVAFEFYQVDEFTFEVVTRR